MSKSIASLEDLSDGIDTVAKLVRLLADMGVTLPQLRRSIDSIRARRNLVAYLGAGCPKFIQLKHIIDCDAPPFLPKGWQVEEHRKGGQLEWDEWDPARVQLWLSESQQNGKHIEGNRLREELADKPCLNANVLDYLLAHPDLIPEDWKRLCIFFWGTIYCDVDGRLCVRHLLHNGYRWDWHSLWLGYAWNDSVPAALAASN